MPTEDNDELHFETAALRWPPELARFSRSLTREHADADDLAQDTFRGARRQWHQFDPGSECRALLFTSYRNRFYLLRERAERTVAVDDPLLESLAAAALFRSAQDSGLGDAFERAELGDAVRTALGARPEAFRDVALLVDLHDHL